MVVTRASHHEIYLHEVRRLSQIVVDQSDPRASPFEFVIYRPNIVAVMEEQFMNTWAKEQIKNLPRFSGSPDEDVIKWLHDVEAIFDRATIQPPNRYLAIQSYLVGAAAKWFRHNKPLIPDWLTFNTELLKSYKPALNVTLFKLEQRFQSADESVMEYYYDKLQLCSQADPTMSPTMIIHHLMKGLKPTLIAHVVRRRPTTPADFLTTAQDEEKIHLTLAGIAIDSGNVPRDYSPYDDSQSEVVNVINRPFKYATRSSSSWDARQPVPPPLMQSTIPRPFLPRTDRRQHDVQRSSAPLASRQCYSCQKLGHLARSCPQRKNM
jgi:Retrotransposon gag protein/Zinc knuckle